MIDYEIPYRLYVYSSGSPEERLSKFLHDVATPMNIVLGYGKILEKQVSTMDNVEPIVFVWRGDLERIGQQLGNLRFAAQANRESWLPEGINFEHLHQVRKDFEQATQILEDIAGRTESMRPEFEAILAQIPELFETVVGQANYLRAMLETVVNPDYQLPADIARWIKDRDRIKELAQAGRGDKEVLEFLLEFVRHPEPEIRGDAAELLGNFKDGRVVDALITALDDEVTWVRARSAKSLGLIGDVRAIEPLTKWKDDEDFMVQRSVDKALENLTAAL